MALMRALFPLFFLILLVACEKPPEEKPLVLEPAAFSDLPGWHEDALAEAAPALRKSCERILKNKEDRAFGPLEAAGTYGDWQPACRTFLEMENPDTTTLRAFFEDSFAPYKVMAGDEEEGLFTGYYEASLRGDLRKYGPYSIPLYSRPDDLVMVNLGEFREHLKGERIAGRVQSGQLKPYETREEIVTGAWPHNDKVLVWVDNAVDAFFVQIQGSGVIDLPGGETMRIGYAGQNGHPYYAIGRELIARGEIAKEDISLQSIREWLAANPDEADMVMNTNRSYVFFRELKGEGPLGGEGVALTPERSLAIDRSLLPYGMPVWLAAEHPAAAQDDKDAPKIQRLMIAQDTGGAIRGPVRGDVFWGHGTHAEDMAGVMKSKGRYWILLPKKPEKN
jgi:membrane-bound lytic murein transglycosylase A